jgi:hypothetical protein
MRRSILALSTLLLSCAAPGPYVEPPAASAWASPPASAWTPPPHSCLRAPAPLYAWAGPDAALPPDDTDDELSACLQVTITLPDHIELTDESGTFTAQVRTNLPPGTYRIEYKRGVFLISPWSDNDVVMQVEGISEEQYPRYLAYLQRLRKPVRLLVQQGGAGAQAPPVSLSAGSMAQHLAESRPLAATEMDTLLSVGCRRATRPIPARVRVS